jgi:hypothetical protein
LTLEIPLTIEMLAGNYDNGIHLTVIAAMLLFDSPRYHNSKAWDCVREGYLL